MRKTGVFHSLGWWTVCPYCREYIDVDYNPIDEGDIGECPKCHKKFISGGWDV